jgi:hypothetical protein
MKKKIKEMMVIIRGSSILYRFLTVIKIIDKSYLYYEPSAIIPAKSVVLCISYSA